MASEVSKPDYSYQWSSGGSIVAPSNVKIQTGWTAEVPPFQWENWSQNRQDNAILHLFQKGISEWDAASNYYFTAAGVRSYVQGSDGLIYVALQDSVGQNPVSAPTYWKLAFAASDNATETVAGIIEIANTAENQAWSDLLRAMTPGGLNNAFKGANQSITTNGYQKLPGGMILQWGTVTSSAVANTTVTYPLQFPNAARAIIGTVGSGTVFESFNTNGTTTTSFQFNANSAGGRNAIQCDWFAIGN